MYMVVYLLILMLQINIFLYFIRLLELQMYSKITFDRLYSSPLN